MPCGARIRPRIHPHTRRSSPKSKEHSKRKSSTRHRLGSFFVIDVSLKNDPTKTQYHVCVLLEKNASPQFILNDRNASREEKKGILRETSPLAAEIAVFGIVTL